MVATSLTFALSLQQHLVPLDIPLDLLPADTLIIDLTFGGQYLSSVAIESVTLVFFQVPSELRFMI